MKFDLFISDYDKTLGDAPDKISPENIEAIKEYTLKGGKFVICTGRMFSSIGPICKKYGLKGLVVSYQGAMINDIETGECLFKGGISNELAIETAKILLAENVPTVLAIGDYIYYEKDSPYIDHYLKAITMPGVKVDSLIDYLKETKASIGKLCAVQEADVIKDLTKRVSQKVDKSLLCNNGASMLLEIVNSKYTKKFGVEFLSKYFDIPYDKIIVVGDSTNDIPLFEGDWYKVAVGDAHEDLKAMADEITVPFREHAISVLLKKYCL